MASIYQERDKKYISDLQQEVGLGENPTSQQINQEQWNYSLIPLQ